MSVLSCINGDCFDHVLSWLNSHQLCKLFWCGDILLDCLLKNRPLNWSIRVDGQQLNLSRLIIESNIHSLDLLMENGVSFWQNMEALKLPTSIRHLSIRQDNNITKMGFMTTSLNENVDLLSNLNLAQSFPLLQSFGMRTSQANFLPQQFVATFGNTMQTLNLFDTAILSHHIQYLPRSLTSLKCLVSTSDSDVDIIDPLFPPNLSHVTLCHDYTDINHVAASYLDCLLLNLPIFIQELHLSSCLVFSKTFYYSLVLSKYMHLTSLSVEWRNWKGAQFVMPLPIPASATSVCYKLIHAQDYEITDYPFDDSPCINLKRLHLEGFRLKSSHYHRLPRNLEFLDWGKNYDYCIQPQMLKLLPPKLTNFRQLVINGNAMFCESRDNLLQIRSSELFQSLRVLKIRSASNELFSILPPNLTTLGIMHLVRGTSHTFGFDSNSKIDHLKNLHISPSSFDATSLHHLPSTQHFESLGIHGNLLTFPFDAPCLKYLISLDICDTWFNSSEKYSVFEPSLNAFRNDLQLLKTLVLKSKSQGKYPTWLFAYLPRNLQNLYIEHVSWQSDLVADLAKLPKDLQRMSILYLHPVSAECVINMDSIDDNTLLPCAQNIVLPQRDRFAPSTPIFNELLILNPNLLQNLSSCYKTLVAKLSCRRHLSM